MAGFLEKLWDETVAGPTPDQGFGSGSGIRNMGPIVRSISNAQPKLPVSRSITLLRTRSLPVGPGPGSDPSSPSCSSPLTPGTPSGEMTFSRKRVPTMEAIEDTDPRSPTVYDWILISALDR